MSHSNRNLQDKLSQDTLHAREKGILVRFSFLRSGISYGAGALGLEVSDRIFGGAIPIQFLSFHVEPQRRLIF